MNSDKTNVEGKFKLAGEVKNKKSSESKSLELEKKSRTRLSLAILFGILFIAATLALTFLYLDRRKQQQELKQTQSNQIQLIKTRDKIEIQNQTIDSLEVEILKLVAANEILLENYETPKGVFFEIQLGKFKQFNLDDYNENLAYLRQEKYEEETELLLGRFRSYQKAVAFERDLRRIGIKKSIIVGRIDEEIVTLKEALNAASEHNK